MDNEIEPRHVLLGVIVLIALVMIERERSILRGRIRELEKQLTEINQKPTVTDHAVIRYLERKHGFSFESTRKEMLSPAVLAAMKIGAGSVKTDGGVMKINGKTIVTFAPKQKKKQSPKGRKPMTDKQAIEQSMNA